MRERALLRKALTLSTSFSHCSMLYVISSASVQQEVAERSEASEDPEWEGYWSAEDVERDGESKIQR